MVGQLIYRREAGNSPLIPLQYGPLTVAAGTLFEPEGLPRRRLTRRLHRLEKTMEAAGVSRIILPEGFPYRRLLARLQPVETLAMYRGLADVLALGWLDSRHISPQQGRVALWGTRLCPELRQAALRLCPQVRELVIRVPEEGERFARCLQRDCGLPVLPGDTPADVVLAFSSGCPHGESVLTLWGEEPRLEGLRLSFSGLALPHHCSQQVLALLWERGSLDRSRLRATISPRALANEGAVCYNN